LLLAFFTMFGTTTVAAPAYAASYAAAPMTTMAAPTYGTTAIAAAPTYGTMAAPTYGTTYGSAVAAPTYGTTAYAAPTMVTAAPTTQVASYVAPPVATTMAAPMMTTMAAPAYAAPAMTTQTASFVAPPAMMPGMPGIVPPAPPAQPVSLTAGLPTPAQIKAQKDGYAAALDKQLTEAMTTVKKETEIEKQMVKFTAEKNIALYYMQVDEALVEQTAFADEQATIAHCELRKALVERNLQLNSQAQNMVMDYQMKALVTDCEMKKYAFAQQYMKEETKLANQYMQQEVKAHTGTAYAAPAAAVRA
jgi:hypothetical protein